MKITLHKRQFCISPSRQEFGPDWRHMDLRQGFVLSYQEDLVVSRVTDGQTERLIFGRSFPSAAGKERALHSLAGRFAVLDWPYVQTDGSGLMALYYGKADRKPFVTSSPALAGLLQGKPDLVATTLNWKRGLNWIPSPGCRVRGVCRILRDQKLKLPDLTVEFLPRPVLPLQSFEEARDTMASGLTHVLAEVEKSYEKVCLALTGGLDSRTLFTALLARGIRFEAVTQILPGMDPNDAKIAADLCRYSGVKHTIVPMSGYDSGAAAALREHSAGSYDDVDPHYLFPGHSYRFLEPNQALVQGGCFELGRRFYEGKLGTLDFWLASGQALSARFGAGADEDTDRLLDQWLAWRRTWGNGLDLPDSFYLDQRIGGWLSSLEHGLDTLSGESIQPANCERLFSAMITSPPAQRRTGVLQRETIRVLDKNLLRFPINPVGLFAKAKNFARRGKRSVREAVHWGIHSWRLSV